jgi:hypothetical protein
MNRQLIKGSTCVNSGIEVVNSFAVARIAQGNHSELDA